MTNNTYPNTLPMTFRFQCSYCDEVHTATREEGAMEKYAATYHHGHFFFGVYCPTTKTHYGVHESNPGRI